VTDAAKVLKGVISRSMMEESELFMSWRVSVSLRFTRSIPSENESPYIPRNWY